MAQVRICLLCRDAGAGACGVGFGLIKVCACTAPAIIAANTAATAKIVKKGARGRGRKRPYDEKAIQAFTATFRFY